MNLYFFLRKLQFALSVQTAFQCRIQLLGTATNHDHNFFVLIVAFNPLYPCILDYNNNY